MEKVVELVMRPQRKSDLLDRLVLGAGLLSLTIAVIGTLTASTPRMVAEDTPASIETPVSAV